MKSESLAQEAKRRYVIPQVRVGGDCVVNYQDVAKDLQEAFIAGGEYALQQLQSQLQALEAENKKLKEEKESLLEQHYKNHPNME